MKTESIEIVFREQDVRQYIKVTDDRNPIYTNIESAQSNGHQTIPLPPTMPMIAYKWIEIPWTLKEPLIHRSQECIHHQTMYINTPYFAQVLLKEKTMRKNYQVVNQILRIVDCDQVLCFEGISQLIAGDLS
ncbi:MaoC family dehydratase [Bacillus sp. T3]|uniref:MaoC family dehydratase n=1 Tax=Bacillus sp. T3 TaxID=467262 RepID=UPI002981D6ED|nr:MaoC family dehydratase [Bacillus sp. T3]